MRASYRFPVRKPECDPTWWTVSDRYVDTVGVSALSGR
ncbi:hypothetical protein QFZ71_002019 [Streptomyces sp. V2I9]|nr:hypothetical protein [Streptomyces sp. V2I9]